MIKIDLIKHHAHHIERLSHIWCEVLGEKWIPEVSIKEVQQFMSTWHHEASLPIGFIALDDDLPIGTGALQQNDGIRPDLKPWLTDLCVDASFQSRGVGASLIKAIQNKASNLGYDKLYLFAFDPNLMGYYERFGFSIYDHDQHRSQPVVVMKCALTLEQEFGAARETRTPKALRATTTSK